MHNTILSDIKIAKNGYTILLWYTVYTYALASCNTSSIVHDLYIDRIPYGLKISQCSDSLAWSKMVSRNNDIDYRLKEGQK